MRWLTVLIAVVVLFIAWDVAWWWGFGVEPMSPWTLKQMVEEHNAPVIIDVRTPGEFHSFHIQGAINVPYPPTLAELASASPDPNNPVVVIGLTGHRSPPVARQLQQGGYTAVTNLTWGMTAWKLFGGPVEEEPSAMSGVE